MKYSCHAVLTVALALALPLTAQTSAQQKTPYVTGSTITGRVLCSDTNAPARFAKVLLKSTEPNHAGEDLVKNLETTIQKYMAKSGQSAKPATPMTDEQKRATADAVSGMNRLLDMANSSTVGLDGRFSFAGIKPGTYYVHAIYPGYFDPFSQFSDEDFASTDPAIRAQIAKIPTITVNGTDSAHVDLVLDRGAAVSGRIVYDDGSPAAGWTVSMAKPNATDDMPDAASVSMSQTLAMSGAVPIFKSDDLGRYRITGLAAGTYVVRANLTATPVGISATLAGGTGIFLTAYSGNTFSRAGAESISLAAGEERSDVNVTIAARLLHNIVGHVYAKSDGHTLNVGQVSLTSQANPALHLNASIRDDGSFHFEYLPGGVTYTLNVEDAADGRSSGHAGNIMGISIPHTEILHKYGPDTMDVPLLDADIDTVRLTVAQTDWTPPAARPGAPAITPGDLVNGILGTSDPSKP